MKTQKGFTLIELMIVVAIIAILAAIAIPQYETYITKTQFSEASTVASGIETDLNLYYNQNGLPCPTNGTSGFAPAASYVGKYVATATIATGTAAAGTATCDIQVVFKSASVSTPLKGKTVLFQGSQSGGNFTWTCTAAAVADKYKPEVCR